MSLQNSFTCFATFGGKKDSTQMDSASFMKCVKESGILDKSNLAVFEATQLLSTTDIDLVFVEYKLPSRKIDYKSFVKCLELIAHRMQANPQKIKQAVARSAPLVLGTVPENDRFLRRMTDPKLYTGSHKERFDESGHGRGLAGAVYADDPITDLSQLTDRKPADARGIKLEKKSGMTSSRSSSSSSLDKTAGSPTRRSPIGSASNGSNPSPLRSPKKSPKNTLLYKSFTTYASFGHGNLVDEMDSAAFAKLMRDSGFMSKDFTSIDVDIIFTKCRPQGAKTRKLDYTSFRNALGMVAAKLQISQEDVESEVAETMPTSSGTMADNDTVVRRMTDPKLYPGTHKHRFDAYGQGLGKHGRVDRGKISDLSELTDRSGCDVRGRKVD